MLPDSGFESAADPAFSAALRDATAGMPARLWITGYLLGPIPTDAWPNGEMARALLQALETPCGRPQPRRRPAPGRTGPSQRPTRRGAELVCE
ncbi:hypothetical protein [Streptomyces brasiliensis]|uniref:hypothetical protein n=1 Tax=Streptomyces brasiliensis TaxID=1954 RepID=UPI00167150AE|nr:hypothetical protein [Streptomyces brasiliensis]